ncbi:hypothetical Protein YC6258_04290 [Gynuella sunshinyii YC6258]|uniref:Uncharacterized protein n=1 Tax=Gynuella sunshinyii YC6258 TaxID=1445510 RepID=A0A0C5W0W9_9GAMM|nr:hypothetical Protein YC6258_04290 [Gynuella sunshinyii YC6258]
MFLMFQQAYTAIDFCFLGNEYMTKIIKKMQFIDHKQTF